MSIKKEACELVERLDDNATWEDLIKELYRQKKVTVGMTEDELVKTELSESDLNAIVGRIESAKAIPDDMRNTKEYKPGNATTLGMVGGVIAVLFSFVFPPIAWFGGMAAVIGGMVGLKNHEEKAWIPILLAIVSLIPMFVIMKH